jgi:tetratricopeptide (TPR) repeat protein
MLVETARLAGIIELRRGNPRQALATWRRALEEVPKSLALVARIRWTIVTNLSYDPGFRGELIKEYERLLTALRDGGLLTKRVAGVPPLEEVEQARRGLVKQKGRLPDFFDPWPEVEGDPTLSLQIELWQALVHAEAVGDQASVVLCLRSLGWQLYEVGKVERAREVALACLGAAERAADVLEQLGAKYLLGNALFALGDNSAARDIFRGLSGIEIASDPEARECVVARLAELDRDPQPRRLSLDMIEMIEGRETRPRSADEGERLARQALKAREFGVMRVVTLEALFLRRLSGDEEGMARCYDILGEAAKVEGRKAQAKRLRARARELR